MVSLNQNHPHINLRVKFKKVGSLQYISHLDLVRTMMKIITRSKLPLWYTEGFNPKPKIVFAAPLSIGIESMCEYMDVKLIDDIPPEEAMRRLNENMTDEMQVLDAYYTEGKLTELKWIAYRIEIFTTDASAEMAEKCAAALATDTIEIEKKAPKPGEKPKTVDIKPLINSLEFSFDGNRKRIILDAILCAESQKFLNPEYVIKALRDRVGILSSPDLTKEYYSIMRVEALLDDLTPFK